MKNLMKLNILVALVIIIFAVLDLLFYFVLDYPSGFTTIMMIAAVVLAALGGLIGWKVKSAGIKFEDNAISEHIGGISEYFNEFATAIAGIALLVSIYTIGYINILTIGSAAFAILTSFNYIKNN